VTRTRGVGRALPLLAALCAFAGPPAHAGVFGDIDLDCDIDVADVVMFERYLAGLTTLTQEQTTNANLVPIGGVRDAVIDVADLITLRRIVAGDAPKPVAAYTTPTITLPTGLPESANPISITGTAQTGVTGLEIVLYVNGQAYSHRAPVDPGTGAFDFGVGDDLDIPLADGDNHISAIALVGNSNHSCNAAPQTRTYHPAAVLSGTNLNFSGDLDNNPAHGDTMVWTPELSAGQPYIITSTLQILSDQNLFIQPGVQVKFANGAKLTVAAGGHLKIFGTPTQMVDLVPNGTCPTIRWGGIEVASNAVPNTAVFYTKIHCVTTGFNVLSGGSGNFQNGVITRFTSAGIRSSNGNHFTGSNFNTIDNTTETAGSSSTGIDVSAPNTFIRGTTIRRANTGIRTSVAQNSIVERNVITGSSRVGIAISGGTGGTVFSQNTVTQNCVGAAFDGAVNAQPRPKFIGNSIFDNNHHCTCTSTTCKDFSHASLPWYQCSPLPPPGWVDATGNWWGSTSASVIESRIVQPCTSNPIDFEPFLSAPYDQLGFFLPGTVVLAASNFNLNGNGEVHDGNKPAPAAEWLVVGTPKVPAGQTFTIPDGQVVKFSRDSQLIVEGTLVVQDLDASDVVFTALMPPGGVPTPGDWRGIKFQGNGTGTIDGAVFEYGTRAVEASDADFEMRDSLIELFSEAGAYLDGSTSDTDLQRNLIDNFPDFDDYAITPTGTGVWLVDASPDLYGNEIQDVEYGMRVVGDSHPRIDGTTADGPNLIHHTTHGISLEGTGTFADPQSPELVDFHENKLYSNSTSNLRLAFIGSAPPVDATQNYWGTTTEAAIRAKFVNANDNGPASVDFSNFLDDNMNVVGGAGLFSSLLSGVDISKHIFAPTLDAPAQDPVISFTLAAPATVTLEMFVESETNPATATPARTLIDAVSLAAGPHTAVWDGKNDAGVHVAEEAYAFHLVASNASLSETFFPSRPPLVFPQGVGQFHGAFDEDVDTYANNFVKVNYNLDVDGRVKVFIDPDRVSTNPTVTGPQPSFLAFSKVLLKRPNPGPDHYYLFDGRYSDSHATSPGQIIDPTTFNGQPATVFVEFPLPETLRPNYVIVERTKPEVKGPSIEPSPNANYPRIEVRPDPYSIVHSYNQLSRFRYCVDQPSNVTIKVLPYGAVAPSGGMPLSSEITVFNGPVGAITNCSSSQFHGVNFDLTGGLTENIDLDGEGVHTFTIEAASQADPAIKTLYRGVLRQRR
jgi:hypothetical protein